MFIISAFNKVFRGIGYVLTAFVVTLSTFTFAVWLPNLKLIEEIITSNNIPFIYKISVPLSFFGSISTNFTVVSASYTIIIAILFGLDVAMFAYYIRRQKQIIRKSGAVAGIGGVVSGMFGIGCAACGTFILTTTLEIFGATGIITFLPFGGEEFGFIGVGLLIYSIIQISLKITNQQRCPLMF